MPQRPSAANALLRQTIRKSLPRPKGSPRSGLNHKLIWYVENFGIALNTVRRHRHLVDDPRALFMHLISRPQTRCSLVKLHQYIKDNGL